MSRQDLQRFAQGQVLTTKELSQALRTTRSKAARIAFNLKRSGFLAPIQRGVYASVPLDADPKKFQPDPYLVVNRALGDQFAFSYFSALALLGGEDTVRRTVHVSGRNVRPRNRALGNLRLHVHPISAKDWSDATRQLRRGGQMLRVTTPERTLVDLASLPNKQQDYEAELQAFRALLPRVDLTKLLREALSAPRKTTRARLGHYLLESSDNSSDVAQVLESLLRSLRGASTSYLGTGPNYRSNRFDPMFRVVYPGQS